jgi:stearoyl-CoA desaturase (delta-9 desaturase)
MITLYVLLTTHITILCVTIYLHRGVTHRGVEFSHVLAHAMRFWLWLTTGMITKQWVAVHRKHHRYTDQAEDPHSPKNTNIFKILFFGALLYRQAVKDKNLVETYGHGAPSDWIERNVYSKYNFAGVTLLLIFNFCVFGWWGIFAWVVQMLWIPFWAAGVVNGLCHYVGYRNHPTKDHSTNLVPWGIVIGGEELHNNHHNDPASPKMSNKPHEFDVGWMWIVVLEKLRLLKTKQKSLAM